MNAAPQSNQTVDTGWIALYTKANQEKKALSHIERQGYQAYCPMIMRTRRHARKVDQVRCPLFPSYVFVQLDETKCQWRPLLSTIGVQSVVRFNDRLGFMPEDFIEELQSYEQNDKLRQMTAPKLKPGMEVKMLEGPFQNIIAKVLSLREKDRVWLLLDIMGQQVRVQHDVWSLTTK